MHHYAKIAPYILLGVPGAGRPVLSLSSQPLPEFGRDAALYFDLLDPDNLSAAILKVLETPALATELGRKAADRSLGYDWSKTAEETWRHILSI